MKDAVGKIGGDKERVQIVLSHLDDVDQKITIVGGAAADALDRIEKLLTASPVIEPSEAVRLRASTGTRKEGPVPSRQERDGRRHPCRDIRRILARQDRSRVRFAFVTYNKNDFSIENGDQKMPHPDFANLFSRVKSLYFINLAEALRRVDPSLVTDIMLELRTQEPRGLTEILEAEDLLFHQVWYNRHWNMRIGIEEGKIKVVDEETFPRQAGAQETIQRDVLKVALEAARNVELAMARRTSGRGVI